VSEDDWRRVIGVNLTGVWLCMKYEIEAMLASGGGTIVNISSTAGLYGYGLRTPYAAAKWAVIGFTKSLAVELGPFNVRANAICPGSVNGARMQQVIKAEADSRGVAIELVQEEYVQSQSIKRFVEPEEIAEMCLFLASPAAKMVTGQALAVDGHTETFHIGS
jgi:NAD(P)-dependent dehydrogenase (short-subunit alcohol dehydrogenase family)